MLIMINIFHKSKIFKILILILFFLSFSNSVFSYTSNPYNVDISAYVGVSAPTQSESKKISIGTDIDNLNLPTTVNFSGFSSPFARIHIVQNGKTIATTLADSNAHFEFSLSGLVNNVYLFSIYSEDSNDRKSSFLSLPIYIKTSATINIDNIYLPPTIDISKTEVKRGNSIYIFGKSIPNSLVTISLNNYNSEYIYKVTSDDKGIYFYNLNTFGLNNGNYNIKSKYNFNNKESLYSKSASFSISSRDILKNNNICENNIGDLNCDNYVDIKDFSILAYWYQNKNFPKKFDLNGDGKISLTDFSIMAYYWNG